ncbi:hypothetical protein ACQPZF_39230 [Actinosynnema sp. CS-041913]|uniref:hypothetical protein n=1 Tax=Actinosynnema sp. CS-041913 TaxID=3239917 RepID=UPI003D8FB979
MTEEPPRNPPPPDLDPEQLRQFQEFQRFQEYQRFQQTQGVQALPPGTSTPPPIAPPPAAPAKPLRKPLWLILLGSKAFRRLIYLLVVLLILSIAYNHYFGTSDESGEPRAQGNQEQVARIPKTPWGLNGTIGRLYQHVGHDIADQGCLLFARDGAAKKKFADAIGAPDCESAIHMLKKQVTNVDQYEKAYPVDTGQQVTRVEVSSCDLDVRGGPRLGRFVLTKLEPSGAWAITDYEAQPADCRTG